MGVSIRKIMSQGANPEQNAHMLIGLISSFLGLGMRTVQMISQSS